MGHGYGVALILGIIGIGRLHVGDVRVVRDLKNGIVSHVPFSSAEDPDVDSMPKLVITIRSMSHETISLEQQCMRNGRHDKSYWLLRKPHKLFRVQQFYKDTPAVSLARGCFLPPMTLA